MYITIILRSCRKPPQACIVQQKKNLGSDKRVEFLGVYANMAIPSITTWLLKETVGYRSRNFGKRIGNKKALLFGFFWQAFR